MVLNELSEGLVDLVGVDEVKHGPLVCVGGHLVLGALRIHLVLVGTGHLVHLSVSVPVLLQGKEQPTGLGRMSLGAASVVHSIMGNRIYTAQRKLPPLKITRMFFWVQIIIDLRVIG